MSNTKFRFPRARFWLLRLLNMLDAPEQPTEQEIQARINAEVHAARTHAVQNVPTRPTAHVAAWVDAMPPTIEQLSPEPFLRFTEPFERAQAINDAARRRRAIQQHERAPMTLHQLPALSRPLQRYLDARNAGHMALTASGWDWRIELLPAESNETPPEHSALCDAWLNSTAGMSEDESDPTERMSALQKLAMKRMA